MALRDECHQDSSTKKVLDYYEKYTQNSNLSKYFSGPGQCLPVIDIPIKENDQNIGKFTITTKTPIPTYSFDKLSFCSKDINNLDSSKPGEISSNKNPLINISSHSPPALQSPSDNKNIEWDDRDSPLDDKKLEWDSGADIGYHIAQSNEEEKKTLRKSLSLPVLHNLRDIQLNIIAPDLTNALGQNDVKVFINSSTPDSTSLNKDLSENSTTASGATSNSIKQANTPISSNTASNSSSQISKAKLSSGCSSNSEELNEESKLLDFKMTLSYLKEKVGLPGAQSTPNTQHCSNIDSEKNTCKSLNKKDANMPITNQPLLPNNGSEIELVCFDMQQNNIISKQVMKMQNQVQNRRVIELTISKPISIDWISSDNIDRSKLKEVYLIQDKVEPKLNPKVDQIETVFKLDLKANKQPPKENEQSSTVHSEHNIESNIIENIIVASNVIKNDSRTYSNCSSNCDSFEYIGNDADNNISKQKKTLQASKDKNNLCVLYDPSPHFKDSQHKDTTPTSNSSSKSVSGSISGDIEKHLDLLRKLLNSKKVHPSKKQFYIRKLSKDISGFKDKDSNLDSNGSSGLFCLKSDKHKNDCLIPSKLQSIKSSSPDTDAKCVTSSSDGSSPDVNTNNVHSEYVADRRRDSDYLLQFAENERDYQINWIDTEISHLTKLKSVLEFKNCKHFNKNKTNKTSSKTSVYKVVQNDGINKKSERDYVIHTKLDNAAGKKMQYCLQGKEYSITDCSIPNTQRNSNENSVRADIKIHAEERQTNIKVSTSCRICNQESCVCESGIKREWTKSCTDKQCDLSKVPTCETASKICSDCQELKCICQRAEPKRDWARSRTEKQYDLSKLHTRETAPKLCADCQELECICQKAEPLKTLFPQCNSSNGSSNLTEKYFEESTHQQKFTEQTEFPGYDLPQHFNSLQKIFQKCCCTVENRVCNCLFVRKLFNRLLPKDNIRFPEDLLSPLIQLKTNVAMTDNENQTSPLISNKEQSKVENSGNSPLGIPKTTQTTTQIFKTPNTTNIKYTNIGAQTSVDWLEKIKYPTNQQDQIINKEIGTKTEVSSSNLQQEIDNNKYKDISAQTSVDWLEMIRYPTNQQDQIINKEIGTKTEVSSSNLRHEIDNNKYKDISAQTSVDWLEKIKHPTNQQDQIINKEIVTKTEVSNLQQEIDNNKYKDISAQTSVDWLEKIRHPTNQQDQIINKEIGTKTQVSSSNLRQEIDNNKYKDISAQTSGDWLEKIKYPTNQQDQVINKEIGINTEVRSSNLRREIDNNKYKDISAQTSVDWLEKIRHSTNHQDEIVTTEDITNIGYNSYLSSNCNSNTNPSRTTATQVVIKTKDSNINQISNQHSRTGVRKYRVGLLTKIEHDNKQQTQITREELVSKADMIMNLASNKSISPHTSDQGYLRQKQESVASQKPKGSGHLKEVTTQTSTQITSKAEATISDETLASYSQAGGKSTSISTSVFDSVNNSSKKLTCKYCRKKQSVGEVTTEQKAVCNRCDNKHIYSVNDVQHQLKYINCHWFDHCNCCTRKVKSSPVISQGVAYNLIMQEPVTNRSEKHVINEGSGDFNLKKAKHRTSENSKINGHKNKHADPSKNDKYQIKNENNYNGSQLELLKGSQPQHTLRDYLIINRPNFIYSAENRRQSVLNSRIFREHQKNSLKLQFLENNINRFADKGSYRLFTEREMKEITKKNYKKLPEIQKKMTDLREKRLRGADKLICDIFAKKVQKSALKGRWNFPIDKTVTNL